MGFQENAADNLSLSPQQQHLHTTSSTGCLPGSHRKTAAPGALPCLCTQHCTFRHFENPVVLLTPADGVQVSSQDVTPEISLAVLAVAVVAQQQQLPARGDDGGDPVGVLVRLDSHFQLHARGKAILQTCIHLKRKKSIIAERLSETLLSKRWNDLGKVSSLAKKLKPNAPPAFSEKQLYHIIGHKLECTQNHR